MFRADLSCFSWHLAAVLVWVCAASAFAVTPPLTPVEPRYEIVDALGATDVVVDIAVDPVGLRPALLYFDTTTAEATIAKPIALKLARFDRFAWVSSTFGMVNRRDLTAPDERSLRLAIDEAGKPHALVVESNGAGVVDDALVYFSVTAQGAPVREQIDVNNVSQIALTIERFGEPYIAYIKNQSAFTGGTLVVRHRAGGTWPQVVLDVPATNALQPSLAPLPALANFLGVRLAWVETGASSSLLRHTFVAADGAQTDTIASSAIQFSLSTPQIVVDRLGTAEVAYISSINPLAPTIELRRRVFNQQAWNCIDTGCALPTGALSSAITLSTHGYVQGALNFRNASAASRILRREGTGWVDYPVASIANAQGSALDRFGNVYTTGIDRSTHRDLFQVRIGGPWEAKGRVPLDSNTLLSHPLDVARDAQGRPVIYARRSSGQPDPRGGVWRFNPAAGFGGSGDFVESPLPGVFTAEDASIAVAPDGTIHLAIYDGDVNRLLHAELVQGAGGTETWTLTPVDLAGGDVGRSPTMLIGAGGMPMIVYRRLPDLLHIAARAPDGNWTIRGLATGVLAAANPVAVASAEGFVLHVSWFAESAAELRITTLRGNPVSGPQTVSTTTLFAPAGWVRGRAHDLALTGDSGLAVAFSDEVNAQSQLGYRYRDQTGTWFDPGADAAPFSTRQITRISLDTTLLSPNGARVAWINGGRLTYAEKHIGLVTWTSEELGSIPPSAAMDLGAAGPLRIIFNEGNGLTVLQRLEPLGGGFGSGITEILGNGTIGLPAYCYCAGLGEFCHGQLGGLVTSAPKTAPRPMVRGGAPPTNDVLADMRALFATTPAGRYYLQLFGEHAAEIIRLTLSDPTLLVQRVRTLSDLVPGMTALVASPAQGDQYRFKPDLIADARSVWQGWASAGSPALAAAVNNELARTNNLNRFTGMTFTQWFDAISVGNATDSLFEDGFE